MLGEVFEEADEGFDRSVGITLLCMQPSQDRQQEHPPRAFGAAGQFALVEFSQAIEAAELKVHALEAVEGGSEARARRHRLFVDLAGAFEFGQVFFEDLAGPELGLGFFFGAEAGFVGGGDLQLEQFEQLRPRFVGDEVAAGVFEGGDVAGEQPQRLAHRRQAVAYAVEADHRQFSEAIEQFGLDAGVGVAEDLELAGAGFDRHFVAGGGHAQFFEISPQTEVAWLGFGGGVEQANGGTAFTDLPQRHARAGQGHRSLFGWAGFGFVLEGLQHQVGAPAGFGEAKQVVQQAEVFRLDLRGGDQEFAGEVGVAGVAGFELGQVAGDCGDGPGVVEHFELGLEVGDQRKNIALGQRDGFDGPQDCEVSRRRFEGGLIALQGCVAVAEVGFDELAAFAVEGCSFAGMPSCADLLVEITDGVADVSAAQECPVKQLHRRPQVGDQL